MNKTEKDRKEQIDSFKELSENWDSYDADKISNIAIKNAIIFSKTCEVNKLRVYHISPTRDGGVCIEFKNPADESAEIYFNSDGTDEFVVFHPDAELKYIGNINDNFNQLLEDFSL